MMLDLTALGLPPEQNTVFQWKPGGPDVTSLLLSWSSDREGLALTEGILSKTGLPDRYLYADHTCMCTHIHKPHLGGIEVSSFLYTCLYAVSHRSHFFARRQTQTLAELHISMSCFFRHLDQRVVVQPMDSKVLWLSPFTRSHLPHS